MQENMDTIQSLTYNDLGQVTQLIRVGHQADMTYQYDLLQGVVSGIASINGLISITFTNDRSIEYYYTADGTRHKAIHVQRLASGSFSRDTTDYVCGMILKGRHPESYQFDGGYATFSNDAYAGWHYYIQDYMGNNRMVVNRNGSTEQKTHYYPYGGVIGDISTNESLQKYKFEGKELDRSFGLDNYDIQARQYFAMAPTWDRVDPLAEKYYGISPYAYCAGDPVNRRDVDGKRLEFEKGSSFNFMYQFHKAYAALDAVGAGSLLKRMLFAASFTITMKELSNEGKEVSRYDKGVILWAPNKAAMLDGNNGSRYYMAPMEILNHEADHGIDDKTNHKEHVANSRSNTDSQYDTVEEKRVITGSEQDTAKKLGKLKSGQVTRTNHDGTSYVSKDVTSEEFDHMPVKNY